MIIWFYDSLQVTEIFRKFSRRIPEHPGGCRWNLSGRTGGYYWVMAAWKGHSLVRPLKTNGWFTWKWGGPRVKEIPNFGVFIIWFSGEAAVRFFGEKNKTPWHSISLGFWLISLGFWLISLDSFFQICLCRVTTMAGSNLASASMIGTTRVINNYRAGEVTAMATHDESSVLDLPKSLTKQEVYTLEN